MKTPLAFLLIIAAFASSAFAGEGEFTFKGFTLGMPLDEAKKLVTGKYASAFRGIVTEPISDETKLGIWASGSTAPHMIVVERMQFIIPVVEADAKKSVTVFRFPSWIVDELFNTGDMSGPDFAKQFLNSYDISTLTPSKFSLMPSTGPIMGWEYISPKGFRIRISKNKDLVIDAVPASTERKFD